jgi:hypothetical protein
MKIKLNCLLPVVVLALTFTACGGGAGGGGIAAKFKFTNSGSLSPTTSIVSRSTQSADSPIQFNLTSDNTFGPYTAFYGSTGPLKAKVGSGITPSVFNVRVSGLSAYGNNGNVGGENMMPNRDVDFRQNEAVTPGEVEAGQYDAVWFSFNGNQSTVKFKWPAAAGTFSSNTQMTAANATIASDIVTVHLDALFPGVIRNASQGTSPEPQVFFNLFYAGSTAKLLHGLAGDSIKASDIIASYPNVELYPALAPFDAFLIPFSGVNVPSDASVVVIEVKWNLDGIIEHYQGPDGVAGGADDIFILKNGWWNALSMSAYTE